MMLFVSAALSQASPSASPIRFNSLFEILVRGGPAMIPLGLCSILALGWILERTLHLRIRTLGSRTQATALAAAAKEGGPAKALELARSHPTVLSRIFQPVFERWDESRPNLEKAVEDSGSRELRALVSGLRPLTVITVSAPLLGLFGTVVGIIIAFREIALSNAMGKPEALASGIAQALVATATGLAIAIPTQASYYWFRSRIDRFWRLVEETGDQVFAAQKERSGSHTTSAPQALSSLPPVISESDRTPLVAQGAP